MCNLRNQIRQKIINIHDNSDHATIIETSIFDFVNRNCKQNDAATSEQTWKLLYVNKALQICKLLKTYQKKNIEISTLSLHNIAELDYKKVYAEKWEQLAPELQVLHNKLKNDEENMYTSTRFTCGNCHQKRCIYTEIQIKACDENCTLFAKCLNCGNVFCPY